MLSMTKLFCMKKVLRLLILFVSLNAQSAETDPFTARYEMKEDGLPIINREMNHKLSSIVSTLNNSSKLSCDDTELRKLLGKKFRWPIRGVIETFIMKSSSVPRSEVTFESSIYYNSSSLHSTIIKVGEIVGIPFAPTIRTSDLLIGADKFGHFLDEGYYYYEMYNTLKMDLEQVLKFGHVLEYSVHGQFLSGVFSFADLAANYEGLRFWTHMLGSERDKKQSIYLDCKNGKWKQIKTIDLAEYISYAWDEGMNCNKFNTQNLQYDIHKGIERLESRYQKRFRCPVYPEMVASMIERYREHAAMLINPSLFN
jgi:hypothetical protein